MSSASQRSSSVITAHVIATKFITVQAIAPLKLVTTLRAGLVCACLVVLSACGQTGPLRLPNEPAAHKHTPTTKPVTNPSPTPAPATPEHES